MRFEVGKYYRHAGGRRIHIVGAVKTTLYGWALVAEEHESSNLVPVAQNVDNTTGWVEVFEGEWLEGFSD